MSRYSDDDAYVDSATGVLRNLLEITDPDGLEAAEADFVSVRAAELTFSPLKGRFDLSHLQAVHQHLFRDVYAWAGLLRTVDISKGNSHFAHHAYLISAAEPIFRKLQGESCLSGLDAGAFCQRAAYYLAELNALHPFREGNGRAQREFINLLARKNGYVFAWKKVDRAELLNASIRFFTGDLAGLNNILQKIIQELPQ